MASTSGAVTLISHKRNAKRWTADMATLPGIWRPEYTSVCTPVLLCHKSRSIKLVAQFSREETSLLVLRVMVGLIILYDWVHPSGAFCRSSSVDVKGCVKFLQQQPPAKAEPLLNALRYTTKHLNHQSTPKNIRALLAA
ncbi:Protein FAM49A [Papilio machaon]|uniref:Protein FAM49A n=1 Tax=Papilio machaon TaxID=76193 RepID=A0A0N1INM0_PAPMA|nr:Protein FAM49A [Papilio machaon]